MDKLYEIWLNHASKNAIRHFMIEAEYQQIPSPYYEQFIAKVEQIFLETEEPDWSNELAEFLQKYQ
ncbi:hypothetical protein GCM10023206_15880 [Acinetobacter puyangensis]|uniref:Uncharacterized protein n=1 Tax=Acinetobacter puyangensis TaxID=1096779 RepID=A0A240E7I2_9GAMM|nr:hypothetical protein [Acinetobacter puyangensis]SNX44694.1 hypothetical protein SAMN05421731_10445 [Acinetobacter puyangensis]